MISGERFDPGVTKPPRPVLDGMIKVAMPNTVQSSLRCRPHSVSFIGDSHGNHAGFQKNMEALGYGESIPPDHHLIVLGDIVADRHVTGIPILLDIEDLRTQGANIEVIAGNHEDLLLSFLFQRLHVNFLDPIDLCQNRHVGVGLLEFGRFQIPPASYWDGLSAPDILEGLRQSAEGYRILQALCAMKVGAQIDETLFVHTDMTDDMAEMILQHGVDTLNEVFQRNLKSFLIEGKNESDIDFFHAIRDVFLSTYNNRTRMTDEYDARGERVSVLSLSQDRARQLQDKYGISRIIHGHADYSRYDPVGNLIESMRSILIGEILVMSADYSAHKRSDFRPHARSVGYIDKEGGLYAYGY